MKSLRLNGLIFIALFYSLSAWGQKSIQDSSITLASIGLVYNGSIPGGHLDDRFGFTNQIGADFTLKFKKNFYLSTGARFLFSSQVREDVARNVTDLIGSPETGYTHQAIGADGKYYHVRFWERGFTIPLVAGKIFPVLSKHNPNSGVFVELGAQFIQHKVRIDVVGENVPQLADEYKPGYDRLTNGIGVVESFGYRYFSNKKLINFQIGFEFSQNFTRSRRDFNYDLGYQDKTKRIDLLHGFRVGWVFPIYKDAAEDLFYF